MPDLQRVRDTLPDRLNTGILRGDGGFCLLGWMLTLAGYHAITLYNNTLFVADPDPARGGPVTDVVAHLYGLSATQVADLARRCDDAPAERRVAVARAALDELIGNG
jgi:hypothetical protein